MVKRDKANYMIQSVSHALDVLEELSKSGGEVGVTDLSNRLKLHKNNVFRLLATLELRGYVDQNLETEDYRLGVKSLQLGQAYLTQSSLVARALPILKHLSADIGETVSLAVLQNGEVRFPLSIESKRPVKVAPRVGRLLMAQLPDAILVEMLSGNSPQDAAIQNQLTDLRAQGVIFDRGAIEADVVSIGKVIRKTGNEVVGAIEVLVPQYRAQVESVMPKIDEAVHQLSTALGAAKVPLSASIEKEVASALASSSLRVR
jgi:IclR family transcriptional regulator, KDG regulon repressor